MLGQVSSAVTGAVDVEVSADVARSSTGRPTEAWVLADGVGGVADGGERLLPTTTDTCSCGCGSRRSRTR
jgi:hypothetical protein